jgi:D-3-phosphoglycerate dehydrogenase
MIEECDCLPGRASDRAAADTRPSRDYVAASREVAISVDSETTTVPRILVADPIASAGIELLEEFCEVVAPSASDLGALTSLVADCAALIVRSQTRVTADLIDAAPRLRVIGRAGIGVDNVDLDAANRRGIVVVNAPTAVVVAAAEHTLALLLALCRHVPQAHQSVASGRWERGRFLGTELRGKTVGIVGLGNIGAEVAQRLAAFDCRLLGSDPYVSPDYAQRLGVELVPLDDLIETADVITLHVPLTPATRGLIGAKEIPRMKPGVRLVNCSRGGVVDEAALVEGLEGGRIAGAALDVFAQEPPTNHALLSSDRVVLTPHLGASTEEAQVAAAIEVARQVIAALRGEPVRHAVNAPPRLAESLSALEPYARLGEKLGFLLSQLVGGTTGRIEVTYVGEIAETDTTAVKAGVVTGLLRAVSPEHVNLLNALLLARNRGWQIVESRVATPQENYANLVVVRVSGVDGFAAELAGTAINGESHLVRVDAYRFDVTLSGGYLLFVRNADRPGVIGKIGTLLGNGDVNISAMQVGRLLPRGEAMMVLAVDEPIPAALLHRLLVESPIQAARLIQL